MELAQCEFCEKKYTTHAAWLRKRKKHFCSRKCSAAWQSKNNKGPNHHQYKESSHNKICANCEKVFDPKGNPNKFCSYKCKGLVIRGKNHGRYRLSIGYSGVHLWLYKEFGYALCCENLYCQKRSIVFEWSLIKGKEYERNRENFWQLCKSCHIIYDRKLYPISNKPISNVPIE